MYEAFSIIDGNIYEVCDHLYMNGYDFKRIGNVLYVLEDQADYVKTILYDRNITFFD